jgi:hypothetical protein
MFNQVDYQSENLTNLLNNFNINDHSILDNEFISISGSTCLKIYDNSSNFNSNDIDIYIHEDIPNEQLKNLIEYLIKINYTVFAHSPDSMSLVNKLKQKEIDNPNATGLLYNGINKHLKNVLQLNHIDIGKHIDLILIDNDIETFISETFDYNMLKNYIHQRKLYMSNEIDVINKHAKMNIDTFYNIFNNEYKFNNFIKRYQKYTSRGFKILLGNKEFTIQMFDKIVKFIINKLTKNTYLENELLYYYNKDHNIRGHINSLEYIKIENDDILLKGIDVINNREILLPLKYPYCNRYTEIFLTFNLKNILLSHKDFWNKNDYLHLINHCIVADDLKEEIVKETFNPKRLMYKIEKYGMEYVLNQI